MLVSCLAYFTTLKMTAIYSSETLVGLQLTTRRYIPEDGILHNHSRENLKSYSVIFVLALICLRMMMIVIIIIKINITLWTCRLCRAFSM
jgi:hypothetical protein